MKALVTGASGMLGTALTPELKKVGFEVCSTDISGDITFLDIRDFECSKSVILGFSPDIIFHLAAETNVDKCELDSKHAYEVNTLGTENIARLSLIVDAVLVYISTMGVFDGKKDGLYNEFDEPNPINIYSRTKLEGEKVVTKLLSKYYIIRAGWMMGGGRKDKKFVAKILDLIGDGEEISAVTDKFGSPTFTKDLSKKMIELVNTNQYGLYHITNSGHCSRYDIALKIVEFLKKDIAVRPVSSDVFPLPAPRIRSEAAESLKLSSIGIKPMRPWEEALRDYLEELVSEKTDER
ncbi:MAG: dTDP-4-dehydrorhamnose reductase [Candidatus Omnitrophica bacterium]|nr:dTDP-4-dehydrorhamnose reductase [Candidatus Omnitrophota bacterium]